MPLRVDTDGLAAGADSTRDRADACRSMAAGAAALGGVTDAAVRDAVHELADVCADAMELVGTDLDLVASRLAAAARVYAVVEWAVAARGIPRR